MVTYLDALVQLCCGEGGTLQTNIAAMWGVLQVYGPHWVCPSSLVCAFQVNTAQVLCRSTIQGGPCISCTSQV